MQVDGRVQGGGCIASKIDSEHLLICNGNGQINDPDQIGIYVDYDVF